MSQSHDAASVHTYIVVSVIVAGLFFRVEGMISCQRRLLLTHAFFFAKIHTHRGSGPPGWISSTLRAKTSDRNRIFVGSAHGLADLAFPRNVVKYSVDSANLAAGSAYTNADLEPVENPLKQSNDSRLLFRS
jgi:hypothetical protein